MADYMNSRVPGVSVPQDLIDELSAAPKDERLAAGIGIAVRTIRAIRDERLCDGVHIMAIGRETVIPEIIRLAGDAACP
jgi:5,10-methylenetetrahydrofolate reductase